MPPPNVSAVRFIIDPSAGGITIRVFAAGMLSAVGHNPRIAVRTFGGEIVLCPNGFAGSSIYLKIPTSSLAVKDELPPHDLEDIEWRMRKEVLEIERFPEVTYQCSQLMAN